MSSNRPLFYNSITELEKIVEEQRADSSALADVMYELRQCCGEGNEPD